MKSTRWILRPLCVLALPILGGCVAPGPYTYGTYPGYYAPPAQGYVGPPGAVLTPGPYPSPTPQLGPATPIPGSPGPSMWSPSSPSPATQTPVPIPQGRFDGGPGIDSPTIGARKPTEDIRVPEPVDGPMPGRPTDSLPRRPIDSLPDRPMDRLPGRPTEPLPGRPIDPPPMGPSITPPLGRRPTEPQPSDSNSSPFGADGQESFKGSQATPPKRAMPAAEQEIAAAGESFESPLERNHLPEPPALRAGLDKMASAKPEAGPPNPYAYDPKSYAYLRGIVDFDPRDNSWHIIYSPNPDRHDKFGGTLQLMNHPDLKTLRSGDFVYLEGHINHEGNGFARQAEIRDRSVMGGGWPRNVVRRKARRSRTDVSAQFSAAPASLRKLVV